MERCEGQHSFVAMLAVGCDRAESPAPAQTRGGGAESWRSQDDTDPAVNPNAAVMADFKARVESYAELHKDLAKGDARQKDDGAPADQRAGRAGREDPGRARRREAGRDLRSRSSPGVPSLLAPELKGEEGRDAKAIIKDDAPAPGTVAFKVNAKYPEGQPKPTMPANLLLNLPPLPEPLEYRVVGQHLLLLDTAADLVVDYMLNVITT